MAKNQKIHIVETVSHLGPGGVQSLVIPLCIELAKKDFAISLLVFDSIQNEYQLEVYNKLLREGVQVIIPKEKLKTKLQKFVHTFSFFLKRKVHIVHSHTPIPPIYTCIPATLFFVKQILTFHNTVLWQTQKEHEHGMAILNFTNRFTNKFIAISETVKSSMVEVYGINEQKINVIYNGINVEKFKKNKGNDLIKNELPQIEDQFIITHVSVINFEIKRQNKIVELYDKILQLIPNALILFIGTGKDYETLKIIIGDKPRIIALGNRSDIAEILSITNITILPSSKEGLPITLLESMAAGIPIIASDVGSIPEIIKSFKNGLTFKYPDFEQFLIYLKDLYLDESLRRKLSNQAQKDVMQYSFKNFVNNHINLYNNILK